MQALDKIRRLGLGQDRERGMGLHADTTVHFVVPSAFIYHSLNAICFAIFPLQHALTARSPSRTRLQTVLIAVIFQPRRAYSVSCRFLQVEFHRRSGSRLVRPPVGNDRVFWEAADWTEMSFGVVVRVDPRNDVLDGDTDPSTGSSKFLWKMGRPNVMCKENAAWVVQKRLNRITEQPIELPAANTVERLSAAATSVSAIRNGDGEITSGNLVRPIFFEYIFAIVP